MNVKAFLTLVRADLITFSRSRVAVFWSLAFPLIVLVAYMHLFAAPRLGEVALAIRDQDQTATSHDFARSVAGILKRQDVVTIHLNPQSGEERARSVTIDVPRGFEAAATGTSSGQVAVTSTSRQDPAIAATLGILRSAVTSWNLAATGRPARAQLTFSAETDNERGDRADYIVAGLIVMIALSSSLMGFAVPLVAAREFGMTRQQSLWPVDRGTMLAAWIGSKLLTISTSAVFLGLVAHFAYGFANNVTPIGLLSAALVMVLATLSLLALGLAVASRTRSTQTALVLANMLYFLGLFTGDLLIPTGGLPGPLRAVLHASPVNNFAHALRSSLQLQTLHLPELIALATPLTAVAVIGIIGFGYASRVYQWSSR
jgi:ABC-2 type transport system permease protein